jgi:hypothetical protein
MRISQKLSLANYLANILNGSANQGCYAKKELCLIMYGWQYILCKVTLFILKVAYHHHANCTTICNASSK